MTQVIARILGAGGSDASVKTSNVSDEEPSYFQVKARNQNVYDVYGTALKGNNEE